MHTRHRAGQVANASLFTVNFPLFTSVLNIILHVIIVGTTDRKRFKFNKDRLIGMCCLLHDSRLRAIEIL